MFYFVVVQNLTLSTNIWIAVTDLLQISFTRLSRLISTNPSFIRHSGRVTSLKMHLAVKIEFCTPEHGILLATGALKMINASWKCV